MKAAVYDRYGPPDVLRVAEVEKPVAGPGDVLIRIHAAAVTTSDNTARSGRPYFSRVAFGVRSPKHAILGTEFAGEIEVVGGDVTDLSPGCQVFAASGASFGAHADYICLPADGAISPKPDNVTYAEAAAICEGALTALPFLRDHGRIQRGHAVLVNGASGAVGTAAVQLARHFEADVTGVCSASKADLVKSLGANTVIDYTAEDFTSTGESYDIVFDAIGKSSFRKCQSVLRSGGTYMTTVPSLSIFPQMLWTSKVGDKRANIAFTGLRPPAERAKDLRFVKELVEAGHLRAVIDRTLPLDDIVDAHLHVESGHKTGSVVVTVA
jgi:NADPH:quinone reductase-like Zn-dependent oxidoreductase